MRSSWTVGLAAAALSGCGLLLDVSADPDASGGLDAAVVRDTGPGDSGAGRADATPPECVDDDGCAAPGRCRGGERCVAGRCVPDEGGVVCSDDALDCTVESCDPDVGCVSVPDDDACPGPTDSGDCRVARCDPVRGCVLAPDAARCDDGVACTVDTCGETGLCGRRLAYERCEALVGLGSVCSPGSVPGDPSGCTPIECGSPSECPVSPSPCVRDVTCSGGACVPELEPDGTPCDDDDPCTLDSACLAGFCEPGTPRPCRDGNPCTRDVCVPDGVGFRCEHPADPAADGAFCDPGEDCTDGTCSGGTCVASAVFCLDDPTTCTFGVCMRNDPARDSCIPSRPCRDQHRVCDGAGSCGACLSGYVECGTPGCCPDMSARDAGPSPTLDAATVDCPAMCPLGQDCCGGTCVDLMMNDGSSPCGSCDLFCGSGSVCEMGSCRP